MSLAIRGGTLVFDGIEMTADLLIEEGKIVAIADVAELPSDNSIDATDCYVIPGLIDLDCLADQGATGHYTTELVAAATRRMLAGGVTTAVLDLPADVDPDSRDRVAADSVVDVAWRSNVVRNDGSRRTALEAARAGKTVGARASLRRVSDDVDALPEDELLGLLRDFSTQRPVTLFPEHGSLGTFAEQDGARGAAAAPGPVTRHPSYLMRAGLRLLASLQEQRVAPIVAHPITSASDVEMLLALRDETGQSMMAMTSLPYVLFFAQDETPPPAGAQPAGHPAPRRKQDAAAIWRAIDAGVIDVISSGLAMRDAAPADAADMPLGDPRYMLSALHAHGCASRHQAWTTFIHAMTDNAAKVAGLWPRKGTFQIGSDADAIIFDPNTSPSVEQASPYAKLTMPGSVRTVVRGGEIVVSEGELRDRLPAGRVQKPAPSELKKV